ncbi:MAG TPA: bifunctional DNA-formamidopyrimidine glycosylase/DNA-(apurinic or apyrimidinic site) lyase [Gemmata sp.]|nr:bifunctional DNA-formamidopyrimidine glycosylase/DNA-(apurinic or apyrimidinic site) lyase [Gemmata sp.]
MPELPEVETVVRDLRPLLAGRIIRGVRQSKRKLRRPWKSDWNARVIGTRIEAIRRRGKWIVVELKRPHPPTLKRPHPPTPSPRRRGGVLTLGGEGQDVAPRLIIHLGMTGQFTAVPVTTPQPDHLHLVFELDNEDELRFRDTRRFGSVTYHIDEAAVEGFFTENGLGPEPFGLDAEYFRAAVRRTSRNLKAILLDQTLAAGVGNIYADEACFRAKLHPGRKGKTLKPEECDRLREAVETVLTKAIESRGSTIRDYVGGSGLRGGFQNEFAVYGRTGEPCPVCATAVKCVRLAGRSSHFCTRCQPSKR